jgi:hypothetical protein
MSQDRRRFRSHEVGEEVKNPKGEGGLFGETPLSTYLKASRVREHRVRSV